MEFQDVIKARYSCRRFLSTPVPEQTVRELELVALAQRVLPVGATPSLGGPTPPTRPWPGGDPCGAARKRTPSCPPLSSSGALMERYRGLERARVNVLGIGRDDKDKRAAH
ncbi:hypothetical protein DFAR_2390002 [Desulfarculales bacterium]